MIETTKSEIGEKLKNPKYFKEVTIQKSRVEFEDNFDGISKEIEDIINIYSQFSSSYDISISSNDTFVIQIHILLFQ